jgi:hypothetical protein
MIIMIGYIQMIILNFYLLIPYTKITAANVSTLIRQLASTIPNAMVTNPAAGQYDRYGNIPQLHPHLLCQQLINTYI